MSKRVNNARSTRLRKGKRQKLPKPSRAIDKFWQNFYKATRL